MDNFQLVVTLAGAAIFVFLLRRVWSDVFSGPSRKEQLARLDAEAKREGRITSTEHLCPVCGAGTIYKRYPHLTVWRCENYPECRGFVKIKAPARPAFATRWEARRKVR